MLKKSILKNFLFGVIVTLLLLPLGASADSAADVLECDETVEINDVFKCVYMGVSDPVDSRLKIHKVNGTVHMSPNYELIKIVPDDNFNVNEKQAHDYIFDFSSDNGVEFNKPAVTFYFRVNENAEKSFKIGFSLFSDAFDNSFSDSEFLSNEIFVIGNDNNQDSNNDEEIINIDLNEDEFKASIANIDYCGVVATSDPTASITINSQNNSCKIAVTLNDSNYKVVNGSETVSLKEGKNKHIIVIEDADGNKVSFTAVIRYNVTSFNENSNTVDYTKLMFIICGIIVFVAIVVFIIMKKIKKKNNN